MNYTMKGIITCMTCMFAVALTMGGPIRRQASQSEKTVPIGGNVTLLCPLVPDDLWKWVYWKKNNITLYSLNVKMNTTTTNNTRYEGRNHATRLTIKDLKKTDSGIYHCKVATLDFIKERGHVLLSVTASTTKPTQPAEDNTIDLVRLIFIPIIPIIFIIITIITITVCLVFKYRKRIKNLLAGFLELAPRNTSTPLDPNSSHREIRDKEGTHTYIPSSDTHGRHDVDVGDRQEESSNASQSLVES